VTTTGHYVIRGGLEGRERLRVLSRVMHTTTMALLDRLGLRDGLVCADVGCGGGDVSQAVARKVAPSGKVLGFDIDPAKLDLARSEAKQQGIENLEFRVADVREAIEDAFQFDVVYSRFLLTHLHEPTSVLNVFHRWVRPGGFVAIEDVDFSGDFTYPESPAFKRYHELYCATVKRRGGDPNIGFRVPALLQQSGFEQVEVSVVQPVALVGEAKLLSPLTMENIAGAVLEDGLATSAEIADVVAALYAFAADPTTLAGTPRIVQAWARRAR
jgi:ubiquinone/menaquinone biosynthesis C-methylase UbiE